MERMNLCRLEMTKAAKKTDKVKKPSQSEGGGRVEDSTVTDERREDAPNDRTVILTDGNDLDNQEAGGSGLQGLSGEESQDTDSSVERARLRLAKTKI